MSLLADLLVRFKLEGDKEVKAGVENVHKGMEQAAKSIDGYGDELSGAMKAAGAGMEDAAAGMGEVGEAAAAAAPETGGLSLVLAAAAAAAAVATAGLGELVSVISDLVQKGIAASSVGQVMNFQFDRLARTVAGAFGPEIQKVIGWIEKFTKIAEQVGQSEIFGRMMEGVDRLMEGVEDLFDAVLPLGEAFGKALAPVVELAEKIAIVVTRVATAIVNSMSRFVDLLNPVLEALENIVAGLSAIVEKAADLMGLGGGLDFGAHKHTGTGALPMQLGSGGRPEDIWAQLARASVMGTSGRTPEQETAENTKKALDALNDIDRSIGGIQPAFSR